MSWWVVLKEMFCVFVFDHWSVPFLYVKRKKNVTNSDSTITWDTIWSLIPVEQICMGKVSVTDASPSQH